MTRFPYYYIRSIWRANGTLAREEVYDLERDPMTSRDLMGTEGAGRVLPQLRAILDSVLAAHPRTKRPGKGPEGM